MNLNEGIVGSDTKIQMKSEMLKQLDHLNETTPDEWERACLLEDEIKKPLLQRLKINDLMRQGKLL